MSPRPDYRPQTNRSRVGDLPSKPGGADDRIWGIAMTVNHHRHHRPGWTALLSLAACSIVLGAQAPRILLTPTTLKLPAGTTTSVIAGTVLTMDEPPKPVTGLRVRLRLPAGPGVTTDTIVATTTLNEWGEFRFVLREPGTFYVELIDPDAHVVAVEDLGEAPITVARGWMSTTILRVPTRLGNGFWGPGAWTLIGAAAGGGIGAVAAGGSSGSPEGARPPASPER